MNAPEILRGPMDRGTPWRLRMERHQWVVATREEITEHVLGAGVPDGQGVLQITLTLVPGLGEEQVRSLVTGVAEQLATDGELRARVDGLSFAVV